MEEEIQAKINTHLQGLVEPAAMLFAAQRVHGDKVRMQTMRAYGQLVDAHCLLTGVIGSALLRVNGKIIEITATSEERNALFASFIIGLESCEDAIANGRYLQAGALLRQEMETVAQLTAIQLGQWVDGQTPNVGVLEESIRRLYGDLSAAAHVAHHDVVRAVTKMEMKDMDLPEPTSGTRYFPVFEKDLARRSFGVHLMLILRVIEQLSIDLSAQHHADRFTELEADAITLAISLMQAEGILEVNK